MSRAKRLCCNSAAPQHNLSEARKRELKTKQAKKSISDTIADLKRQGMVKCHGSVESRYYAQVGYKDEDGKRDDLVRAANSIAGGRKRSASFSTTQERLSSGFGLYAETHT